MKLVFGEFATFFHASAPFREYYLEMGEEFLVEAAVNRSMVVHKNVFFAIVWVEYSFLEDVISLSKAL